MGRRREWCVSGNEDSGKEGWEEGKGGEKGKDSGCEGDEDDEAMLAMRANKQQRVWMITYALLFTYLFYFSSRF